MSSLESFPFEASASFESPKLEIVSSESTSSDRSPPAKVLKLDISSPESMSSEVPPLKGKALTHEVGIKTDSKMLTDHTSVTLDCESYSSESCSSESYSSESYSSESYSSESYSSESCSESYSSDDDGVDDFLSHPDMVAYCKAARDSGGFDVPPVDEGLNVCGLIVPITTLDEAEREYLKPLCIAAIDYFNENEHKKYWYKKLVKANCEVTCGTQYYLTFEAINLEDGTNQTLLALVLDGFPKEGDGRCLMVSFCKREADFTREATMKARRYLEESQAMITKASTRIIEQGFDAAMFTHEAINNTCIPIISYLKLTKQFTRHEDRRIRDGLLSHGISNNIIKKPGLATIVDVIKFLTYLKSPLGQQAQYFEQQRAKLCREGSKQCHSPVEAQALITEASTRIIEHGFDAALFTNDAVHAAGLRINDYLKLAKQFTMFEDRQYRDKVLTRGLRNNIIKTPSSSTFTDVVNFLYYLSLPREQKLQYYKQMAELSRKANDGQVEGKAVPQMDDSAAAQKCGSIVEDAGGVEALPAADSLTYPAKGKSKRTASVLEATPTQGKNKRVVNIQEYYPLD